MQTSIVDLQGWNQRYLTERHRPPPTPLVMEIAKAMPPGRALDLACGTGRNALWLAQQGWQVTAVDGSAAAIDTVNTRAAEAAVEVDARVADLEAHQFAISPEAYDLIAICFYLQRDLFEPAKRGDVPGGVLIAIVHITDPGEEPTRHRLRPGELPAYFKDWEILYNFEGSPHDSEHHRASAEIAARKPLRA